MEKGEKHKVDGVRLKSIGVRSKEQERVRGGFVLAGIVANS